MMHLMATPTDQRVADLVREAAGEGAARMDDAHLRRLAEDIAALIALLPREETSGVVYDKLGDALTCLLDAREALRTRRP